MRRHLLKPVVLAIALCNGLTTVYAQTATASSAPSSELSFRIGSILREQWSKLSAVSWPEFRWPELSFTGGAPAGGFLRAQGLTGPELFPAPLLSPIQTPPEALQRLVLLDAWRLARQNDGSLRAARAGHAASQERLPQARAQLLPTIQFSASRFDNQVDRDGLNSLSQPLNTFDRYASQNQTLQLRQALVRPQLWAQIDQAQAQLRESDANLRREEQASSVRVAGAYFEAMLARDQVDLVVEQQRFLVAVLEAETRAFAAGTGTRTAVDEAQARLDLNRAQELEARQNELFTRRQLQAVVRQPVDGLARLNPEGLGMESLVTEPLDVWTQRSLSGSPELAAVQAQLESAQLEVSKARRAHLPTLDLVAQSLRSRSENIVSPQSSYDSRAVGLQLNVPLYGGGYVNSVTRQASAEAERLKEQLDALREDIAVRVLREYRGVTEGVARVRGLEVAARSAETALESARRSQGAGLRTAIDVLNAEQQRQVVQRDLAQARYQLIMASLRLQALAGGAEEVAIERISRSLVP